MHATDQASNGHQGPSQVGCKRVLLLLLFLLLQELLSELLLLACWWWCWGSPQDAFKQLQFMV